MLLFGVLWIVLSFIYLLLDFYFIRFITSDVKTLKLTFIIAFVTCGPVVMLVLLLAVLAVFIDKSNFIVFKRKNRCLKPGKNISSDQI